MTDFGPLIANPKTLLLGAAAQIGVFVALGGAMALGFTAQEAAAIGIIGGADGPTSIYLATKLAPHLLGAIAVAAYSYMSFSTVDSTTCNEIIYDSKRARNCYGAVA